MAPRRRGARIDVTGALNMIENAADSAVIARQDLQIELATAGEEKMKQLIETRGTGRRWKKPHRAKDNPATGDLRIGSYPGRVNTGNMRDSVTKRFEIGDIKSFAAFGWLRNQEDYFLYQEYGFNHLKAGYRVPGMFALRDARLYVTKEVLPRLAKKYEKRIARGKY